MFFFSEEILMTDGQAVTVFLYIFQTKAFLRHICMHLNNCMSVAYALLLTGIQNYLQQHKAIFISPTLFVTRETR